MIKKIIIALWIAIAATLFFALLLFIAISQGWVGYMPPVKELMNPSYKFATEILSADGKRLGTWSASNENRIQANYSDISPHVIHALIATEDVRFEEHSGVDAKALARAIIKRGIFRQKNAGGGSTITQQLSKMLYSPIAQSSKERTLQKPIEWVIAAKLERYYTKEEILTLYLNKFDFINNAVGIKTAASTYFSTDPKNLKMEEAAVLVGMCKNPVDYNPLRYNERSKRRRNVVLDQTRKAGYITRQECDSLKNLPLKLRFVRTDLMGGNATYLREYLREIITATPPIKGYYKDENKQKFFEDSLAWETNPLYGWCEKKENRKKDGSKYNIYTDGLKIYTTLDSRMQRYAEEAVQEHLGNTLQEQFFAEKSGNKNGPFAKSLTLDEIDAMMEQSMRRTERYKAMKKSGASDAKIKEAFNTPVEMSVFTWKGDKDTIMTPLDSISYHKYFLRTGFISVNAANGHVKAYVGGPDYTHFQYDMAMKGRRQIGSTVKPFLYTLAMENGFNPCDETRLTEQTIILENGTPWTPENSNKDHEGEMVTLRWALANSDNWISVYLMSKLNPYALVQTIHRFGILNKNIDPTPSLSLGTCEVSVSEMAGAYTAFANKGIRTVPLFVTRIEDNEGNILSTFTPQMAEVMSNINTYKMLVMLRDVVNKGTAARIRRDYGINADMGGKTGTTNNNADGWFVGFTPSLVSACWVGGEDPSIRFDSTKDGQGASMALPIWAKYMAKVFQDKSLIYSQGEEFNIPEELINPCDEKPNPQRVPRHGLDELFN